MSNFTAGPRADHTQAVVFAPTAARHVADLEWERLIEKEGKLGAELEDLDLCVADLEYIASLGKRAKSPAVRAALEAAWHLRMSLGHIYLGWTVPPASVRRITATGQLLGPCLTCDRTELGARLASATSASERQALRQIHIFREMLVLAVSMSF